MVWARRTRASDPRIRNPYSTAKQLRRRRRRSRFRPKRSVIGRRSEPSARTLRTGGHHAVKGDQRGAGLAARRLAWSVSGAARRTVAGMAWTQLRRSSSPRRRVSSVGTKPVRPDGRGRFEAWRRAERAVGEGLKRGRKVKRRRLLLTGVAGAMLAIGALAAQTVHASARASALEPRSLARAQTIRGQLDARYRVLRSRGLAVTEATSTGVVESFALLALRSAGDAHSPGRQRDLLRDLPAACYLSVSGPPIRPSGCGVRSPPAGARARAPHVLGDVGRRRRRLASHAALYPLRGRARGARTGGRPLDPGEGARPQPLARPLLIARGDRRPAHPPSGLRDPRSRTNTQRTGDPRSRASLADCKR